jgi:hypothetical protein
LRQGGDRRRYLEDNDKVDNAASNQKHPALRLMSFPVSKAMDFSVSFRKLILVFGINNGTFAKGEEETIKVDGKRLYRMPKEISEWQEGFWFGARRRPQALSGR